MSNPSVSRTKKLLSAVAALVKAKAMALKSKTSALKTRLVIFGLLRNKSVLIRAISHKIYALIAEEKHGDDCFNTPNELLSKEENASDDSVKIEVTPQDTGDIEQDHQEDDIDAAEPTLELEDDEVEDEGDGSVIDLVRSFRKDGADFNLEDEIDRVADVYIRRFHKQMMIQKQESFKRYLEMLERSV